MSFFENARSKWRTNYKAGAPKKPNPYYQEHLDAQDRWFIHGYDWIKEHELDSFFYNLTDTEYENELLRAGFDVQNVDPALICSDKSFEDLSEEDLANISNETKILLILADRFSEQLEIVRDELITSMLDSMDEAAYAQAFRKVWGMSQEEAESKDWGDSDE